MAFIKVYINYESQKLNSVAFILIDSSDNINQKSYQHMIDSTKIHTINRRLLYFSLSEPMVD